VRVDDQESRTGADTLDSGSGRRRLVEIRCGFAELARLEAEAAEARVADSRSRFDAELAVLTAAQAAVDLGAVRGAKEEAHRRFRRSIGEARARAQVELAAAAWLAEINRVNGTARSAQTRVQRERDATDALASEIDRLTAIAETSRAMAESALKACRAAQEALTATHGKEAALAAGDPSNGSAAELMSAHEAAQVAPAEPQPAATLATAAIRRTAPAFAVVKDATAGAGVPAPDEKTAPVDLRGLKPPTIVRLLQRDGATMSRLVDWLSGPDTEQRRRWQLCLSNFVDAVTATAIDNGYFVFAAGDPFWDQLTVAEAREVARGLAALGFRYDGMGEFADGRVPGQRELSMALGQAGLLTVRVRNWPRPEEAALLYRHLRVDPIALLAEKAPSITMGELVLMLGRRAEVAADLWNDWSRARPLLLLPSRE
jgi:hypothetical protein